MQWLQNFHSFFRRIGVWSASRSAKSVFRFAVVVHSKSVIEILFYSKHFIIYCKLVISEIAKWCVFFIMIRSIACRTAWKVLFNRLKILLNYSKILVCRCAKTLFCKTDFCKVSWRKTRLSRQHHPALKSPFFSIQIALVDHRNRPFGILFLRKQPFYPLKA